MALDSVHDSNLNSVQEENWDYYIGDTRKYWKGPLPPKDHRSYKQAVANVDRLYHPYNICAEVVDQYVNALIGKPFSWSLKDANGESSPEAEAIIADWFEWQTEVAIDSDLGDPIANAITQMLVRDQGQGAGVGYLRLYSPDIYQNLESYQAVVVHAPEPGTVTAERNRDGILHKVEYIFGEGEKEVYELMPNGNTRITNEKANTVEELDFGGRLPIIELKGRAIITDAIKRGQDSINKTLTIKDINIETAGYLEKVFTNALPPGEFIEDGEGNVTYKSDPKAMDVGPGSYTFVQGVHVGDWKNPTDIKDPQVVFRQPVPIQAFRDGVELDTAVIYFQAGLAYLLSSGDGKISGKSRLTLKEDFLIRLRVYERIIEAAIRKVLTIVIKYLSEYYPILEGYKPVVELNLAVSPLPEEREQNREDLKIGGMSLTTFIGANSMDVGKEMKLIEKDLPLLARASQIFNHSASETHASERMEDKTREQAKGNSLST